MAQLILTLLGQDRPGLVSRVSDRVAEAGGSWLESRLAHLAGQFAGIVLISLDETKVAELSAALDALRDEGLRVALDDAKAGQAAPVSGLGLDLDLLCQDRPGILREITRALADCGANIEELTTDVLSGSFSGEMMFKARAKLLLTTPDHLAALQGRLEDLGDDLVVDIHLTRAPDGHDQERHGNPGLPGGRSGGDARSAIASPPARA